MRTLPPPARPETSIRACVRPMSRPVTVTAPPVPAVPLPSVPLPVASSRPETATAPSLPESVMLPLRPATLRASIVPDRFTAWRAMSRAAAAVRITEPPSAEIVPEERTRAPRPAAFVGTATCRKPSPERSSVARSPEPRPTLPIGTLIVPAFETWPPISAA
ncbi:hypothetical protein CHKEEEPN_0532 [Methylorubrum podarium]|nr:hypothetical protein CHKEEEPN_0532 [Methylorubrum podarium]